MKETRLGDFEEIILLLVAILDEEAYAYRITKEFESQIGRAVSIGAVHASLTRLSEKGFLKSVLGGASPNRGGRKKRIYQITASGQKALTAARDLKLSLWNQYPPLSLDFSL